MNENELFVDNPLALSGLFAEGVYLAGEKRSVASEFIGAGSAGILVALHYPQLEQIPAKALDLLAKIMTAVKWEGKTLQASDYAVVNTGRLPDNKTLNDVLQDFGPVKMLLWTDAWFLQDKEIQFYQRGWVQNVEILRCHSLHTVMADAERKKACWNAIRAYFGM